MATTNSNSSIIIYVPECFNSLHWTSLLIKCNAQKISCFFHFETIYVFFLIIISNTHQFSWQRNNLKFKQGSSCRILVPTDRLFFSKPAYIIIMYSQAQINWFTYMTPWHLLEIDKMLDPCDSWYRDHCKHWNLYYTDIVQMELNWCRIWECIAIANVYEWTAEG